MELKFRAWGLESKQYYECLSAPCKVEGNQLSPWIKKPNEWIDILKEPYVLEQWTGLKDKNGKDIYEGDIVNTVCGNNYVVEYWSHNWTGFVITLDGGETFQAYLSDYGELEVIGNIHERG